MTSGTPASHFFLSPPEDGLSSGDMEEASEGSLGEKKAEQNIWNSGAAVYTFRTKQN